MPEDQPGAVTAALLDEIRRLAAQLLPEDEPAVVFHP